MYHIIMLLWIPRWIDTFQLKYASLGEELECMCETGNVHDLYAVDVVITGTETVEQLRWPLL